jgi:hypothetical protein
VSDSFGIASQTEKVTGQVVDDGVPVSGGSVTVSSFDGSQTVGVDSSGHFTATFHYNLFQELQGSAKSHSVTASYGGATVGTNTFATSSGSANAPNNTLSLLFQLLFLDLIAMQLGL